MKKERKLSRFMITAGASGSGKTLITCGILQALKNRGLTAASFKCGPDYIDPMFHSKVIGVRSGNLDTFFTDAQTVRFLLERNSRDCDLAVLEGVMGYYDGVGGITTRASAFDVAKKTETPAVLIVNCKGMSVSILPYIKGFLEFEKDSQIQGVLLNQMSAMLYPRVKKMIEEQLGISVYGYVPRLEECVIESRHLGLVLPEEVADFHEKLNKMARILENTVDIDGLIALAETAPELYETESKEPRMQKEKGVRIGLAQDEAFCFIYKENLQLLKELGAELIPFSPIHDAHMPKKLDGLLFYGGYPELYGKQLEENEQMRRELRAALLEGVPVMAECGGFLYLHDTFEDMQGKKCRGLGIINGEAYRTERLSRFGYIEVDSRQRPVFGKKVDVCPAHEFHYFDSANCGTAFYAKKPESSRGWECMHATENMLAGFPHFYYYGNPHLAEAFVERCYEQNKGQLDSGST